MACDECRELNTHQFRSPSDLVHAFQVAAAEVDRGALVRVQANEYALPEELAIGSAIASGALPNSVLYRFKCAVCGDAFELSADTEQGSGGWSRNDETLGQ